MRVDLCSMNKICCLCGIDIFFNYISFSCSHQLCYECFPYLVLDLLKNQNSQKKYFSKPEWKCKCIVCLQGITTISFETFSYYDKKEISSILLCQFCEIKQSSHYCQECNQNFCDECLTSHHNINKKFKNHEIIEIMKNTNCSDSKKKIKCNCYPRNPVENFCEECKVAVCQYCAVVSHKNHSQIRIDEKFYEMPKLNFILKKHVLENLLKDFMIFQTNLFDNIQNNINEYDKEFSDLSDEIILQLQTLKKRHLNKANEEYSIVKNKMNTIQNSTEYLIEELKNEELIFPNKIFRLGQICKKDFLFCALKITPKINENSHIKIFLNNLLQNLEETNINSLKFYMTEENIADIEKNYSNFISETENITNCFDLLNDSSLDSSKIIANPIDNFSLHAAFLKSGISASFMQNNDTFLVWGGKEPENNKYCIYINNLSKKNEKKFFLKKVTGLISVLGVYPKESNEMSTSKKLLYSGDTCGVLRIFDLKDKNFKEIAKIETNNSQGLISAILFNDGFNEIDLNIKKIYALVSLVSPASSIFNLFLYDLEGTIIRKIINPMKKCCATINYFLDEFEKKTCIYLGFSCSFVSMYDLKNNLLENKFQTVNHVTSINFLSKIPPIKFEQITHLIIFTQQKSDKITIGNLNNGNILNEIQIPNITDIYDLYLWDDKKEFKFVTASGINFVHYIMIVSCDPWKIGGGLHILKQIKSENYIPINLIKIMEKVNSKEKEKNILISFRLNFEECSLMI